MTEIRPAGVIEFWMGDVLEDVAHLPDAMQRWFQGGRKLDRQIADRFGTAVEHALDGGFRDWEEDIRSRVALIILLDQFPRNVFRQTPRAFAGDERALELARQAVESGEDRCLEYPERVFLLMPYQHVEDRETQRESVMLFQALEDEAKAHGAPPAVVDWLAASREFAELHRDIILQFGRFPHRNDSLGRKHTPEEREWLEQGGQRFGQ